MKAASPLVLADASAALLFYGPIAPHLASGKLTALAILGDERYAALPDVPTVAKQGFTFTPTLASTARQCACS